MTDNDMISTKDILKARRRAAITNATRRRCVSNERNASRQKMTSGKQAKAKRTAQLQALLKPATELAEQDEQP